MIKKFNPMEEVFQQHHQNAILRVQWNLLRKNFCSENLIDFLSDTDQENFGLVRKIYCLVFQDRFLLLTSKFEGIFFFCKKNQNLPQRLLKLSENFLIFCKSFYRGVVKTGIYVITEKFWLNFLCKKDVYFLLSISDCRSLVKKFQRSCQSCILRVLMNFLWEIFTFYIKKTTFFGTLSWKVPAFCQKMFRGLAKMPTMCW